MTPHYVIEDITHCEWLGEYATPHAAWAQLQQWAQLPWDAQPNLAPCGSAQTCGRDYHLHIYDKSKEPWVLLDTVAALTVDAQGARWSAAAPAHLAALAASAQRTDDYA